MNGGKAVVAAVAAPVVAVFVLLLVVTVVLGPRAAAGHPDCPVSADVLVDAGGSTFVDKGGAANAWGGYSNGRIPLSELCAIPWAARELLRCDATAALEVLNVAFRAEFGGDLAVSDGYRDYDRQVATKKAKGVLAATPGTSNHGWGLAADFASNVNRYDSAQYRWMKANGARFGWFHPTWAEPGHPDYAKPEPWHWQFVPGTATQTEPGACLGGNRDLGAAAAAERGWTGSQWTCLEQLWTRESDWNHLAQNPTSSAYGIPQALPGSKMAGHGADWQTNPATQIAWGLDYIAGRYGTPCEAWAHSEQTGWY